jgi:hypothetical protein
VIVKSSSQRGLFSWSILLSPPSISPVFEERASGVNTAFRNFDAQENTRWWSGPTLGCSMRRETYSRFDWDTIQSSMRSQTQYSLADLRFRKWEQERWNSSLRLKSNLLHHWSEFLYPFDDERGLQPTRTHPQRKCHWEVNETVGGNSYRR